MTPTLVDEIAKIIDPNAYNLGRWADKPEKGKPEFDNLVLARLELARSVARYRAIIILEKMMGIRRSKVYEALVADELQSWKQRMPRVSPALMERLIRVRLHDNLPSIVVSFPRKAVG